MIRILALIAALILTTPATAQDTVATITGVATVVDGDGIKFGDVEIRLQGIAAPEYGAKRDPRGAESRQALIDLVWGKLITCHLDGTTASSNRPVGVCYLGLKDIGQHQVENGHARDCAAFSGGRYAAAEKRSAFRLAEVYPLPRYC